MFRMECRRCGRVIHYEPALDGLPACHKCGWDAETEAERYVTLAYLAGVILGDGWCTRLTLGLRVADEDFARAFQQAILEVFQKKVSCKTDNRGYWLIRSSNKTGKYNSLLDYEPENDAEKCAWIRGMFDSEGNASLASSKMSENSWHRRASFYSTNTETLERVAIYLNDLGMETAVRAVKNGKGHIGTKIVYELKIRSSQANYRSFAKLVGSSIRRKREVLERIPESYQPPGHHARAGRKGMASRKARRDAGGKY